LSGWRLSSRTGSWRADPSRHVWQESLPEDSRRLRRWVRASSLLRDSPRRGCRRLLSVSGRLPALSDSECRVRATGNLAHGRTPWPDLRTLLRESADVRAFPAGESILERHREPDLLTSLRAPVRDRAQTGRER